MIKYSPNELAFQEYYKGGDKKAFLEKVIKISNNMFIDPNWLMAVMYSESGLNPRAQNWKYLVNGEPATGLIQFVKKTAESLGTTTSKLFAMSGVDQLDYVETYFVRTGKLSRVKSFHDLYLITFYPAAVGKSLDWQFPKSVLKDNPSLDMNKNGVLTISDFKEYTQSRVRNYLKNKPKKIVDAFYGQRDRTGEVLLTAIALLICFGLILTLASFL